MNVIQPSPTVFVTLRESTVATLMALRSDDETLDAVTARCADLARKASPVATAPAPALAPPPPAEPAPPVVATVSTWPEATSGFYVASIFGAPVGADTLGALLRNLVDAIHDLDPAAIECLSGMKARTRRYAACVTQAQNSISVSRGMKLGPVIAKCFQSCAAERLPSGAQIS